MLPNSVAATAVVLAFTLASATSPAGALSFKTTTYRVGHSPNAVAAGDFNADGRVDLAIANSCADVDCLENGVVKVLLGNGDGTFSPHHAYQSALNGSSTDITAADFNGDGKLDIAVVNGGYSVKGDVSILLGNGKGGFGSPMPSKPDGVPLFVVAGDFNGDGKMDMAVTLLADSVAVLLGNGDGTFQRAVTYPTEVSPQLVAVADLNADGNPDLVVVNSCGHSYGCKRGTVSVLLGRGDGSFGPQQSYPVGIRPLAVAIADFNHDGKPDLAVSLCLDDGCNANEGVGILLGNGDGSFQTAVPYIGTGNSIVRLGVADFDLDGNPDVVALNYRTANISVFLGNGDGTLQSALPFKVGIQPLSVAIGKFDLGSRPDMAIVNQSSLNLGVLLNRRK